VQVGKKGRLAVLVSAVRSSPFALLAFRIVPQLPCSAFAAHWAGQAWVLVGQHDSVHRRLQKTLMLCLFALKQMQECNICYAWNAPFVVIPSRDVVQEKHDKSAGDKVPSWGLDKRQEMKQDCCEMEVETSKKDNIHGPHTIGGRLNCVTITTDMLQTGAFCKNNCSTNVKIKSELLFRGTCFIESNWNCCQTVHKEMKILAVLLLTVTTRKSCHFAHGWMPFSNSFQWILIVDV